MNQSQIMWKRNITSFWTSFIAALDSGCYQNSTKVFAQQIKLPNCNILFAFLSRENGSFLLSDFVDFLLSAPMFLRSSIYADLLSLCCVPGWNGRCVRQTSFCSRGVDILARKIDNKEITHQLQLQCVLQRKSIKSGCYVMGTYRSMINWQRPGGSDVSAELWRWVGICSVEGEEEGTPGRENSTYKHLLGKNGMWWVQGTEKNPKWLEWQEPGGRRVWYGNSNSYVTAVKPQAS